MNSGDYSQSDFNSDDIQDLKRRINELEKRIEKLELKHQSPYHDDIFGNDKLLD